MTIGQDGAINFEAHEAWWQYCADIERADPWKLIRDLEDEYIIHIYNDKEWYIKMNEPNDEQKARMKDLLKYRDEYMCERNVWQGQCAFSCPVFQTCPYKAQGIYK